MLLFWVRICVAVALTVKGSDCFQWTANLPEGTIRYACVGDDLQLPWDYTTSPGDDVTSVQWFFDGASQEIIAMYSHGNFLKMATFSNRVQYVPNAGIVVGQMVTGDTGNYSVEINGHDASGTFFTYRHTVIVQITKTDQLMTIDGHLHATLEPQAIYSNTRGEWSLVVSCGNFTYLGDPPFVVEWLTPSGAVSPSTRYEDGRFKLEVVCGGDYTCRIPQQAAADVCLNQSTHQATVHLDRMEVRMTLLEARQAQLQKDNELLKAKNNRLEENESNLTQYVRDLEQSVQNLSAKVNQRIGFTARLSSDHTSGGTMVYSDVISSYGSGYSSSTGVFTAPTAACTSSPPCQDRTATTIIPILTLRRKARSSVTSTHLVTRKEIQAHVVQLHT